MFLQNYYNLMHDIYMRTPLKSGASSSAIITLSNGESYYYSIGYGASSGVPYFMVNPILLNYGKITTESAENQLTLPSDNIVSSTTSSYATNLYLVFGSGTTPVTIDDYNIESPILNLEFSKISNTCTEDSFTITITGHNLNDEEITVSEMCFFGCIGPDESKYRLSALYREVFDSPITVPADGYFKFSYTIQMTIG